MLFTHIGAPLSGIILGKWYKLVFYFTESTYLEIRLTLGLYNGPPWNHSFSSRELGRRELYAINAILQPNDVPSTQMDVLPSSIIRSWVGFYTLEIDFPRPSIGKCLKFLQSLDDAKKNPQIR